MEMLISACIALLEGIFFLGLFGSAVVIMLTAVEDVKVLLERKE